MRDWEIKATIYLALTAAATLAIALLFSPDDFSLRGGAVLCLWACGVLAGMGWQLLICRKHDKPSDIQRS